MAFIKIQVRGLKEVNARLQQMDSSVSVENLRRVLFDAIDLIRKEALAILQAHTRRSDKLRSDWRHIEDALTSQVGKSNVYASAFAKVSSRIAPQARWLEFGHRIVGHRPGRVDRGNRTMPRPFFRPAVDAKRTEVRKRVREGIALLLEGKSPFAPASVNSVGSQGAYSDAAGDFRN